METTTAKQHQQILPDSTTTILSGKQQQQEFIQAGNGALHISADTGGLDPSFTDLLLNSDNFFLGGSTDTFLSDHKHVSSFLTDNKPVQASETTFLPSDKSVEPDVLDLTTSTHLLPASTNPTLLGGTLVTEDSNVVTSTSQDEAAVNNYRKTNVIILPQPPTALLTTPSFVEGDNNVYTLTLTDGSVVQLRVQNDVMQQQQQQQLTQLTQLLQQQHHQLKEEEQEEELTALESCCWLQSDGSESRCADCESCSEVRHSSASPSSVAEEVTLPFSNPSTPPSSPHDLPVNMKALSSNETATDLLRESLSPVSPREVMPIYNYAALTMSKTRSCSTPSTLPSAPVMFRSSSISSSEEDSFSQAHDGSSGASTYDDDDFTANDLSALFASLDNVTIESLKARLCAGLPEGPTVDLGALLVAAKIDLTVNEIVSPPLTTVKKIMEQKGLSDWQVALCLKIRRRKKNTAAVRSSRRKRNQYVVDLRHHVDDLRKRRNDLEVEHSLLEQLTSLWERLCKEVENEIQEGVKQQLGFQLAAASSLSPATASNHHEDQQQQQQQSQQQLEQQHQSKPPTPVIVMQRTTTATTTTTSKIDKTVYPNTRGGKRKMVVEAPVVVKNLRGKRRLLVEDLDCTCPLVPVHLQPRLGEEDACGQTSCLLLRDEVVPQALSPTSSRSLTSATTSAALIYIKPEVHDLYQTGNA